jgi:protocatechuate 3,4-dioxygenase beta subunit
LRTGNYKVRFRLGSTFSYEWFDNTYSCEDGIPVAVQAGQVTPDVNARLEDWADIEGFIEGRVSDGVGNPLPSVSVSAYDATGNSLFSTGTDGNGNYRLRRLAPGPVRVFFSAFPNGGNHVSEYYPDKATLAEAVPVQVESGQTAYGTDAQLQAGGTVSGRVTDSAGNPFQGVSVTCFAEGSERSSLVTTNAAGEYIIGGLPPGNYRVRFRPPSGFHLLEWYNNKNSFATANTVSIVVGQTTSGIDAQLSIGDGGSVSGRVTNGSGAGIEGVPVWVYDSNRPATIVSSETDADGYYTVRGIPAGSAKVFFNTDLRYLRVASKYYNDRATFDTAVPVTIVQGQTTPGINAVLGPVPSLLITTPSLSNGEIGAAYDVHLEATGGRPFYLWSLVSGSLPDGLIFDGNGRIHGAPR